MYINVLNNEILLVVDMFTYYQLKVHAVNGNSTLSKL